ncbi:Vacuolar fusion protein mon1b [Phlyctochytrium planicorne]|nr:Vacuolar fusion protein mon1b [Phlyctochytrium planicorne]
MTVRTRSRSGSISHGSSTPRSRSGSVASSVHSVFRPPASAASAALNAPPRPPSPTGTSSTPTQRTFSATIHPSASSTTPFPDTNLFKGDDPLSIAAAAVAAAAYEAERDRIQHRNPSSSSSASVSSTKPHYYAHGQDSQYFSENAGDEAQPAAKTAPLLSAASSTPFTASPILEKGSMPSLEEVGGDVNVGTARTSVASEAKGGSGGEVARNDGEWTKRKRHYFVLSSAGKPVYSRYGDDTSALTTYMGIIQALMSSFLSASDSLQSFQAGSHRFVFSTKGPLYLLAISSAGESESELRRQLDNLYSQILFTLTLSQLERIFEKRLNYDLRGLLTGTEVFFDEMLRSHLKGPPWFLKSFQCLRVRSAVRNSVHGILVNGAPKNLLYALLIAKDKVVGMARSKRFPLHGMDVLLLINMVNGSTTFRSAESWTPICLPTFHSGAFVHAYVCFLTQDLCLVLVSPDKDAFFEMSAFRSAVASGLDSNGCVDEIEDAILADPYKLVELKVPGIRHFVCRPKGISQITEPYPVPPYTKKSDYRRLMSQYQYSHSKLEQVEGNVKLIFQTTQHETVVGWSSNSYEFLTSFSPLVGKDVVSSSLTSLQKWVKANEGEIFVVAVPVFG